MQAVVYLNKLSHHGIEVNERVHGLVLLLMNQRYRPGGEAILIPS